MRLCNFCYLQDAYALAAQIGKEITITPLSLYGSDEQCSQTLYSATGVLVSLNGYRLFWLATLPERCVCQPR